VNLLCKSSFYKYIFYDLYSEQFINIFKDREIVFKWSARQSATFANTSLSVVYFYIILFLPI